MTLHYTLLNEHHPETVLLLHGMGSAGEDWELQLAALAPHYRVLAPDARGHGRSHRPPGPYAIAQMTDEVVALLDQLSLGPVHAVGLSMGGCMAMQLAIAHPSRVRSLVLVNTFARIRPAGWQGLRRFIQRVWALQFGSLSAVGMSVTGNLFPKPEQADLRRLALERFNSHNTSKETYRTILRAVVQFNARRHLQRVACPTLVVSGDRDLTVPMSCKVDLHKGIPGSEFLVIPDSGHGTPIDQAERFNEALLGFLQKQAVKMTTDASRG
jgi:3-oxoadipate enol-lactonase